MVGGPELEYRFPDGRVVRARAEAEGRYVVVDEMSGSASRIVEYAPGDFEIRSEVAGVAHFTHSSWDKVLHRAV